ncbi:ABC transporter substrate-binding protein [Vibrio porteresiae]|uniref:ABC transporter substrate-binding protein n=1 Tax=Vibrio porteresiae DSM 19223 TaxID=1123496 RepID=A0ABZ0Q9D1_9VIBR|nr:ABC transporter substrate-binding protein [Vibrio porteresiae]WPC72782.1 ABC transporter substrate-binding protein [Vibrio porteresiae DSM 19223]
MKMKTLSLLLLAVMAQTAQAKDITIGLNSDPDALDPDTSTTMVGREVYTSLFDKLVDIDQQLNIIPMLATSWGWVDHNQGLVMKLRQGVKFQDGTDFDAEAVKFNLERSINLKGSRRKGELSVVKSVEVVDKNTVKINLTKPFIPLLAALADRAGMMVSPTAVKKEGDKFAQHPVGTGPYQFESRIAQDRIVLTKFKGYWDAEHYHFDKVTFLPLPDSTIRLANLESGQLDIAERVAPTDIEKVKSNPKLKVIEATSIGYNGIIFNLGYGANKDKDMAVKNPLVREAFEYAIDRNVINQVVFANQYIPDNQWVSTESDYHAPNLPVPQRDVEKAKALLKQAGYTNGVSIELMIANTSEATQIGQVIQAMAGEAGINIKLKTMDFATTLQVENKGEYEAYILGWSGRVDPDGNIYSFYGKGAPLNENGFDDEQVQSLLDTARTEQDVAKRKALYAQAMTRVTQLRPWIYLYHPKWQWAISSNIKHFTPFGDGMPRLRDVE